MCRAHHDLDVETLEVGGKVSAKEQVGVGCELERQ